MTSLGSVSVCLASHDGERWIADQLASILRQLGPDDEVIVVDDASTDGTLNVVRTIGDPRIRLVESPSNVGYVKAFELAMSLATKEHVFLADQDDIWPDGRVSVMQKALATADVVAGNVVTMDGEFLRSPYTRRPWRLTADPGSLLSRAVVLVRLAGSAEPYFGSAMAVRKHVLGRALPFPPCVLELHDAWFALLGLLAGRMAHVDAPVVLRRIHEHNASGQVRATRVVLRGRYYFALMLVAAVSRNRGAKRRRH